MSNSTPQMGPGGAMSTASAGGSESRPMASPPAGISAAKEGCGCGGGGGVSAAASAPPMLMSGVDESAPMLRPAAEGITSGGITAWQNNKRITGLWTINQNRNSWVHVDGVGWKKLANNSDSAIMALTVLGSHAREKNSPVNYREEADGMIREMYVW